jgi:membrane-associated phospholipid phosphatase
VNFWQALTDLGDAAFLASFALGITVWLAARSSLLLAAAWIAVFGAAILIVAATKLAFLGWGLGIHSIDFTGVSGHATLAGAIFPVLAYLAISRTHLLIRLVCQGLAVLLAIGIGVSRVVLNAHSPSEVVLGLMLGFAVSASIIKFVPVRGSERFPRIAPVLLVTMLGLGAAFYGERAHAQRWLVAVALQVSGRDRPFNRGTWQTEAAVARPDTGVHSLPR